MTLVYPRRYDIIFYIMLDESVFAVMTGLKSSFALANKAGYPLIKSLIA